ncbi:glutathione S-transferase [Denitromonas iodatirespirans]|uniref:Glutathione S-transferase n=1 Tax=Denitromonas iodatirespirans TaxID=2795389 RepID=A0A944D8S0_DENI1|nr:glutathione S-transferase [Denitromonas iodatirespirans]MBT0960441.1 glutathione S-transferase [Denitromonas iodatirespirans]
MSRPVLYSFRRCPYAIRARLALGQAGVAVELREVVLRDKPAAMLAISPKGTVPVLQLPDGRVIDESLDIMRWALGRHDPENWLTIGDADTQAALIARNDIGFKPLLDRYKYAERFPEKPAAAWRDEAVAVHLADLDGRLAHAPYLFGATPALADAALFPFVRQFAGVDPAWFDMAPLPALRRWLAGWLGSDLFAAVMKKQPPWRAADGCA